DNGIAAAADDLDRLVRRRAARKIRNRKVAAGKEFLGRAGATRLDEVRVTGIAREQQLSAVKLSAGLDLRVRADGRPGRGREHLDVELPGDRLAGHGAKDDAVVVDGVFAIRRQNDVGLGGGKTVAGEAD